MKTTFLIGLFAIGIFSPKLQNAEDTPPANAKVISVTTSTDATIKLYLKATTYNTPVWIETSSGNFIKKLIGTSWDNSDYTVSGTSLKVYGDVTYFGVIKQIDKVKALDVSQNSELQALHCQNNSLIKLNVANGNNVNFIGFLGGTAFDATSNPNLQCIQIDHRFTPPTTGNNKWRKDDTANWGTSCNISTSDIENQSTVKLYPNLAKDFVNISGLSDGQLTKIEVFGMAGEKVMELSTTQAQVRVNLGSLSIGNYVIRISNEEQNQNFKLIKK